MLFGKLFGTLPLIVLIPTATVQGYTPCAGNFPLASLRPNRINSLHMVEELSFREYAQLVAADSSAVLPELFGAGLILAIGAFAYANAVYTPEILENSTQMRLQLREVEVQKLLAVVRNHEANGLDLEDLRRPLEETFGTTIEEYVSNVAAKKIEVTSADESLAEVLKSTCR